MLLRKQDIDPQVADKLPPSAWAAKMPQTVFLLIATLLAASIALLFIGIRMKYPPESAWGALSVPALLMSFVGYVWALASVRREMSQKGTIIPKALRGLASLDPVEREYCRTVAALAESTAIVEDGARELLADLNRLLAAHRMLMREEKSKKARASHEEKAVQTLRQLRASLKRAGKVASEPPVSPVAVAEQTVEETISRVQLQARSLEQATEEVQRLGRQ